MFEYFSGKLIEKNGYSAILDVGGIGYKLLIPPYLDTKLPHRGEPVLLYASWVVKETSQTLYGFLESAQRDLFELLLNVSGIGPKTALNLVGHFALDELREAVYTNNSDALSKIPGVGKKTAEKIILDLKTRLKTTSLPSSPSKVQDALNALLHLGCAQDVAQKAVTLAFKELSLDADLSLLISTALRYSRSNFKTCN